MPKRMPARERLMYLEAVILRDGDLCLLCRRMPLLERTLDHVNGRSRDNRLENLVLLCRACNTAEGNRARRGGINRRLLTPASLPQYRARAAETLANASRFQKMPDPSGARVTVSEGEMGRPRPGEPGIDRRGWGSAEEAANQVMEPTYRLWLFRWVKDRGFIGRADAVDAGAEYLDQAVGRASQQTVERYFRKAISSTGWLEERRGEGSAPVWGFRVGIAIEILQRALEQRMRPIALILAATSADEEARC